MGIYAKASSSVRNTVQKYTKRLLQSSKEEVSSRDTSLLQYWEIIDIIHHVEIVK